jgi:hypothetical protein
MPSSTLPLPLAAPVAAFVGPVPRYAPGERAPGTELGPRTRAGGSRLPRLMQRERILAPRC